MVSLQNQSLKSASALRFEHFSGIVDAHKDRLPSLVPICPVLVEKIAQTCHTKGAQKCCFFKFFPSNPGTLAEGWGQIFTQNRLKKIYVVPQKMSLLAFSSESQT